MVDIKQTVLTKLYQEICMVFLICNRINLHFDDVKFTFRTALHWASKRGHPTIVRFLLENGADLTLTNGKGETAAQLTDKEDIHSILGGP